MVNDLIDRLITAAHCGDAALLDEVNSLDTGQVKYVLAGLARLAASRKPAPVSTLTHVSNTAQANSTDRAGGWTAEVLPWFGLPSVAWIREGDLSQA